MYEWRRPADYRREGSHQNLAHVQTQVEKQAGRKFGETNGKPLLLSVRSGAVVSMPGMMDTVLNLGLNDEVVAAMVKTTGNKKWAFDCYRRLIQVHTCHVLCA